MAVRTIECSACGSTVPYGRLSCPGCGELLASVAGAARRLTTLATLGETAGPPATSPAAAAATVPVDAELPAMAPSASRRRGGPRSVRAVLHDIEPATPEVEEEAPAAVDSTTLAAPAATTWAEPVTGPVAAPPPAFDALPPLPDQSPASALPRWPGDGVEVALARPATPPSAGTSVQSAVQGAAALPGAYVPPQPFATASPALDGMPAGPAAPARAWAGNGGRSAGGAGTSDADGETSGRLDLLGLTDPARRDEAIGWVAVAGAAIASVGFLLPWSVSIVGADGIGYFDRWGFAGPGHLLVVAAMLAVMALAVVENPIPAWLRLGVPGLALGALVIGLLWPYLFGLDGAQLGAPVTLVGAFVLIAAAIAALATSRHREDVPAV